MPKHFSILIQASINIEQFGRFLEEKMFQFWMFNNDSFAIQIMRHKNRKKDKYLYLFKLLNIREPKKQNPFKKRTSKHRRRNLLKNIWRRKKQTQNTLQKSRRKTIQRKKQRIQRIRKNNQKKIVSVYHPDIFWITDDLHRAVPVKNEIQGFQYFT